VTVNNNMGAAELLRKYLSESPAGSTCSEMVRDGS